MNKEEIIKLIEDRIKELKEVYNIDLKEGSKNQYCLFSLLELDKILKQIRK